ncbi:hypothetical protein ACFW04_000954 [Cataglyphis niger]
MLKTNVILFRSVIFNSIEFCIAILLIVSIV